VLEVPMHKLRN